MVQVGTASAALSATTAQTIQGTATYIQFNGIPLTTTAELLSIQIGSDTYTADSSGNMYLNGSTTAFTTPITTVTKFDDVKAIVTANGTAQTLSSVIPAVDRIDDDGDSSFTLTGNITATWKDQFGTKITSLSDPLKLCYSNYTLTLTANNPSIETQYGDPRLTTYGDATAVFKFSVPTTRIEPCWAKPQLIQGTGQYAGPATKWDTARGFITQATSAPWGANFPTTGGDALYFDLTFAGASSYPTWDMTLVPVNEISYTLTQVSSNTVRVKLSGPTSTSTIKIPTAMPTELLIKGTDDENKNLEYGFTLQRWHVVEPTYGFVGPTAATYCTTLDPLYRLPKLRELTNAIGTSSGPAGALSIPAYGTGASSGNYYQRDISGALFSEWGYVNFYTGSGYGANRHWTSDITSGYRWIASTVNGEATYVTTTIDVHSGICVTP